MGGDFETLVEGSGQSGDGGGARIIYVWKVNE